MMVNDINMRDLNSGGLLIALFKNPRNAELVYHDLLMRKYDKNDVTIMMSEKTQKKYFVHEDVSKIDLGTKSLEGLGVGGAIGGTIGALAAAIAAAGTTLILPGFGIVVAGAFAAALAGAGAGAFTGGLVGFLIGLGISDEQAREFEDGIKNGGVVISVDTMSPDDYKLLNNKWKAYQREES